MLFREIGFRLGLDRFPDERKRAVNWLDGSDETVLDHFVIALLQMATSSLLRASTSMKGIHLSAVTSSRKLIFPRQASRAKDTQLLK